MEKEQRVYEYQRQVVLKDGTVRTYKKVCKYTPVDKDQKVSKHKIILRLKDATPDQLRRINDILNENLGGNPPEGNPAGIPEGVPEGNPPENQPEAALAPPDAPKEEQK